MLWICLFLFLKSHLSPRLSAHLGAMDFMLIVFITLYEKGIYMHLPKVGFKLPISCWVLWEAREGMPGWRSFCKFQRWGKTHHVVARLQHILPNSLQTARTTEGKSKELGGGDGGGWTNPGRSTACAWLSLFWDTGFFYKRCGCLFLPEGTLTSTYIW